MNQTLIKAYKIIFGQEPLAELKDWEVATRILHKWSVPKIGEDLAKECIFAIVNHIKYPSEATTHLIVGEAEEKGVELFPEIGVRDPSMDVYEWLENKYWESKNKENGSSEIKIK
ncbi:MAG: hypothetical protein AAB374_01180 [Patescibacteria group bacterium]